MGGAEPGCTANPRSAPLLPGERRARSTWVALGGALAVAGAAALLPPGIYLGFREGATIN